jgi:PAS domain S-box-containing protein
VKSVKAQASDLTVVMLTAPTAGDVETAALDLGADDIVVKSGIFRRRLIATLRHVHQRLELVEQHTTLRAREARLRQIVETLPAGLAIISGDGSVIAINAAALALVGAGKPTDLVGRTFSSLVVADHREAVEDLFKRIGGGERSGLTFDVQGPDGVTRQVELRGALLERDARGGRGVIAVLQPPVAKPDPPAPVEDLSGKLTEAEQAIKDWEAKYKQLSAALVSERQGGQRLRQALEAQKQDLQTALGGHGETTKALEALRTELQNSTEAHAWERASWENARQELQNKLNDARTASLSHAETEASLEAVRAELRQATETHAWERAAWEDDRRRLTDQIQELEASLVERAQVDATLEAVRTEHRHAVEALSWERSRWETDREQLTGRLRHLEDAASGRAEIEATLETTRADLREATNTLAWERASWETSRRHHEHQIRALEEARGADRESSDRERERFEAATDELRRQIDTEQRARENAERAFEQARQQADEPIRALKAEHASAIHAIEAQFGQTIERLRREIASMEADRGQLASELARADSSQHWLADCGFVGHAVMTPDGALVRCNDAFARMFGYLDADDAIARTSGAPFPATAGRTELDARLIARRELPYVDSCLARLDGRPLRVVECASVVADDTGTPKLIERVFVEMNVRTDLEDRLRQAQRLEEVGKLAAAMSPDIEALLATIEGAGARQAADLIRQLARFSRKQSRRPDPVDVNELVKKMEPLLTRLVGAHLDFQIALGTTELASAGEDDLEQLLTALVVGVRDLLTVGGAIRLETAAGRTDGATEGGLDLKSGPTLTITVAAAGYGVQPPQVTPSLEQLAQRCGGSLDVFHDAGRLGLQVHIPCFATAGSGLKVHDSGSAVQGSTER